MTTILERTDNYLASQANNPTILRTLLAELASELRLSTWRINRLQGEFQALAKQALSIPKQAVPERATEPPARSWLDVWHDLNRED